MIDSAALNALEGGTVVAAVNAPTEPASAAKSVADLRELLGWLDDSHQRHQDALAAALHDQLGSSLTALAMRLAMIERQSGTDPKLVAQWGKANLQLSAISATVRQVQKQLRPVALEVLGLRPALSEYLLQFGLRTNIDCTLRFEADDDAFSLADAAMLFRIIQQALANVEQHSQARRLTLSVLRSAHRPSVALDDDGIGFDPDAALLRTSHGLRLLRERATLLRMAVEVVSSPGKGCQITLRDQVTS